MPMLQQLAEVLNAEWQGQKDYEVTGLAEPHEAQAHHLAVALEQKNLQALRNSKAGIILLPEALFSEAFQGRNILIVPHARRAFAQLLDIFYPEPPCDFSIDPRAAVAASAQIASDVEIAPYAVIEAHCIIETGTRIGPHVVVSRGSRIGCNCRISAHVYLGPNTQLGSQVVIQAGAVIGSDGYGFFQDDGRHIKIPQRGRVVIEDDVEIGANVSIDRGTFGDTRIGQGSKLDNLVQIGHNVKVGKHALLVAQVGISGSTELGDYVTMAGQAGSAGHLKIGDHVTVAAKAGVTRNIPEGQMISGYPAQEHRRALKEQAVLKKILHKEMIKKHQN